MIHKWERALLKVLIIRLLLLTLLAIVAVIAIAFSNIEYVGLITLFSILTGVGVVFPHQSKTAVGKFLQL